MTAAPIESTEPGFFANGLPFDKDGNPRVRFVRVTVDGASAICEPREAEDLAGESGTMQEVYLSQQEFEALPEFTGF